MQSRLWGPVVACAALVLGLSVYLADRDPARSLLIPAVPALAVGGLFGTIGQWLPSAVHPFAFGLLTAAVLPAGRAWGDAACAAWCAVNLLFELGQHPAIAGPLARALRAGVPDPFERLLGAYFVRGTFDPGDLVAALLGATAAALLLRRPAFRLRVRDAR